jgi:hypothetical protein
MTLWDIGLVFGLIFIVGTVIGYGSRLIWEYWS